MMSAVQSVYSEDVVEHIGTASSLGLVSRVHGQSDEELDSDDDSQDDDYQDSLPEHSARVCWLALAEEKGKDDAVPVEMLKVVDRAFLHGDIVAAAKDALGQTGTVVGVRMEVDVHKQGCNEAAALRVPSSRLQHIRPFRPGHYVVHSNWLGRVEEVMDHVVVRFQDGSMCRVSHATPDRLIPSSPGSLFPDEEQCPYYPGLVVRAASGYVLRNARWLSGSWRGKMEGVVAAVKPGEVTVFWIAAGKFPSGSSHPPPETVYAKGLFALSYFSYTCWQLGDHALLAPEARGESEDAPTSVRGEGATAGAAVAASQGADAVPKGESPAGVGCSGSVEKRFFSSSLNPFSAPFKPRQPVPTDTPGSKPACSGAGAAADGGAGTAPEAGGCEGAESAQARKRRSLRKSRRARQQKKSECENAVEAAVQVVGTHTYIDVMWQDGTVTYNQEAREYVPVNHLGEHDFWPEEYVLERGEDAYVAGEGQLASDALRRVGLVRQVSSADRTAVVQWLPRDAQGSTVLPLAAGDDAPQSTLVSVYELLEHPDYNYRLGDVVLRLHAPGASGGGSAQTAVGCGSGDGDRGASSGSGSSSASDGGEEEGSEEEGQGGGATERGEWGEETTERAVRGESRAQALSWVGEIVGLHQGWVKVAWADGVISEMGPADIYVVSRDDESLGPELEGSLRGSESEAASGSWETVGSGGGGWEEREELTLRWEQERAHEEEHTWLHAHQRAAAAAKPEVAPVDPRPPATHGTADHHIETGIDGEDCDAADVQSRTALETLSRRDWSSAGQAWRKQEGKGGSALKPRGAEDESASLVLNPLALQGAAPPPQEEQGASPGFLRRLGRLMDSTMSSAVSKLYQTPKGAASAGGGDTRAQEHSPGLSELVLLEPPASRALLPGGVFSACDARTMVPGSLRSPAPSQAANPSNSSGDEAEARTERKMGQKRSGAVAVKDFAHFDSVEVAVEHHFLVRPSQPTNQREFQRKIHKEWTMLRQNLPDTIWVRCFEDRTDLLRAAIMGASGTPYHDGLYIFDICLPAAYPQEPPEVYYISGGLRINPNLYENGRVCLSLLNTWAGKGSEVWHPATSSILQVLVSIQGLVLVPKPYYNEAGYERQTGTPEGEKNARLYNESAFLQCCKTMINLLRNPPASFEKLVIAHFVERRAHILACCTQYLSGARVGSLSAYTQSDVRPVAFDSCSEATVASEVGLQDAAVVNAPYTYVLAKADTVEDGCSEGFKLILHKIVPRLEEAFRGLDSD